MVEPVKSISTGTQGARSHVPFAGEQENRPWGYFRVLIRGSGFQVKLLVINPGQATSLQFHRHRDEFWFVVDGSPQVLKDSDTFQLNAGGTLAIPKKVTHRITVPDGEPQVQIIEVQTGAIITEEDVVRIADKYGRHVPRTS